MADKAVPGDKVTALWHMRTNGGTAGATQSSPHPIAAIRRLHRDVRVMPEGPVTLLLPRRTACQGGPPHGWNIRGSCNCRRATRSQGPVCVSGWTNPQHPPRPEHSPRGHNQQAIVTA